MSVLAGDVPYWPHLAALGGIWALVVISPGPDFVVTVSHAARSRRAGLAAAAGIVVGTAAWASASALGVGPVLAHYRWIAEVVRLAGAGYLMWLGARMMVRTRRPLPAASPAAAGTAGAAPRLGRPWRAGLLADLGNPKAAAFWTSLFASVMPPAAPVWVRVLASALVTAVAAAWYTGVACAFSVTTVTSAYRKAKVWIDRITGGVLAGLAVRLAAGH